MEFWIKKYKKEIMITTVVISIALFMIDGIIGIRVFWGLLIFLFLPVYLIIENTQLDLDEKIIFSLFIGVGLVPVILYYLNLIIPSLKLSALILWIILMLIGLGLYKTKKHSKKKTF